MHEINFLRRNAPYVANSQISISPSDSTVGSFFTMAFLRAILITPRPNVTVTTIGKPSGMAATAKLKAEKETKIQRETKKNRQTDRQTDK